MTLVYSSARARKNEDMAQIEIEFETSGLESYPT